MINHGEIIPPDPDKVVAELDFKFDDFRRQKVLYDAEAYSQMSKRLMLMRKGDYPSDPAMGVHIGKYRFADMDTLVAGLLRDVIIQQHTTYIPGLNVTNVDISSLKRRGGAVLYIVITCMSPVVQKLDHVILQDYTSLITSVVTFERPKLIRVEE